MILFCTTHSEHQNGGYGVPDVFLFTREKVFRLKPVLDEHVTLIKELADSMEV